jgi:rRNA maturation endonuclease Nob1
MDIIDFLWNVHQQGRISQAEADVSAANQSMDSLRSQLTRALQQLDHVNLVTLAMWELLSERLGVTAEQLQAKVVEIDLRDGKKDDRYAGKTPVCAGCGREFPPWRRRCLYCGGQPGGGAGVEELTRPGGRKPT